MDHRRTKGLAGLGKLQVPFPVAVCASQCRAVAMAWVSKSEGAVFKWQRASEPLCDPRNDEPVSLHVRRDHEDISPRQLKGL